MRSRALQFVADWYPSARNGSWSMAERRKSERSRTYLGGVIAFNKRRSTMSCHVRNISPAGAKVALTNATVIPDQFDLAIAQKDRLYRARMVWRGVNEAGVAFLSEYSQVSCRPCWSGSSGCAGPRLRRPLCVSGSRG